MTDPKWEHRKLWVNEQGLCPECGSLLRYTGSIQWDEICIDSIMDRLHCVTCCEIFWFFWHEGVLTIYSSVEDRNWPWNAGQKQSVW